MRMLHHHWVHQAKVDVDVAKHNLNLALRLAHDEGIGYGTLARWLDQTEAAVRLKFKRAGWS